MKLCRLNRAWDAGFANFTGRIKGAITLALQNGFVGRIVLVCVDGGPITQLEQREIVTIMAHALSDAATAQHKEQSKLKPVFVVKMVNPPSLAHLTVIRLQKQKHTCS